MWHQIELALSNEISSGVLRPGTQLPNEASLAERFGVNRHTARRALATLAEKGVVRIRRGLGTFVEPPFLTYPISERTRFTAALEQQNRTASHDLIEAFEEPAGLEIAEALKVAPGTPVTVLRTVGLADGVPVNVAATYCPSQRFPGLPDLYRELRSLTAVLRTFGIVDFRRATTRVTAGLPTDEEAARLGQSRREPVLVVESVDVDTDGVPISYSKVRFAGERVQLVIG